MSVYMDSRRWISFTGSRMRESCTSGSERGKPCKGLTYLPKSCQYGQRYEILNNFFYSFLVFACYDNKKDAQWSVFTCGNRMRQLVCHSDTGDKEEEIRNVTFDCTDDRTDFSNSYCSDFCSGVFYNCQIYEKLWNHRFC